MASSTKALLGDRAVKDAPSVGASGGPAISHRSDATAAAHGRLMSELKDKLLAVTRKTPEPEETGQSPRDSSSRPQSSGDDYTVGTRPRAAGEPAKRLPTTPVPPRSCRQHADVQVRVTLRCPCSPLDNTVEATQTEKVTKRWKYTDGFRQSGIVSRMVERFNEKNSLQESSVLTAVNVAKSARSSIRCKTPSAGDAQSPEEVSESESDQKKEEGSQNLSGRTSCQGTEQSSPRLSSEERRQRVRQVLAQAEDTLSDMLRDLSRCSSTQESFATGLSPAPRMSQALDVSSVLLSLTSLFEKEAVEAETDREALEEDYENSLDPRITSRRYIVRDELDDINDHIQSRWAEVYAQLQRNLNKRLSQMLADCQRCKQDEAKVSQDERLLNNTTEAWRQLVTDIRADFHTACVDFDQWRTDYLDYVHQTSCAAVHRSQRLWVLGAVLSEEIIVSLAIVERRTRARVAALWKKLVERRELDLYA